MKNNDIIAELQQQIGLCEDMKAFRRPKRQSAINNLPVFLYTIARHTYLNYILRHYKNPGVILATPSPGVYGKPVCVISPV